MDLSRNPLSAAWENQIAAWTGLGSMGPPSRYSLPRVYCAWAEPASAAFISQSMAWEISSGEEPALSRASFASWYWAFSFPDRAAFSNHFRAAASSHSDPTPCRSIQPMRYWTAPSWFWLSSTLNPRKAAEKYQADCRPSGSVPTPSRYRLPSSQAA